MKLIAPAKPIVDDVIFKRLQFETGITLFTDKDIITVTDNKAKFLALFRPWIQSSKIFKIEGLDKFKYDYVTDGITGAFHDLYLTNDHAYTFPGEYPYHSSFRGNVKIKNPSEMSPYTPLIISHPFSATGNMHKDFENIMGVCEKHRIPVMLDMAFFGVSRSLPFNLNDYPAIKQVAFSLSKPFATGYFKVGVLYTKDKLDTPLAMLNEWTYVNQLSTLIHTSLIKDISPDYIFEKYRDKQISICNSCGLQPSDTVLFGITEDSEYDEYTREGVINRVCLAYELQK